MSDLLGQQLATVQDNRQPGPNTIASTTTIAPSSFITYVSGTIDIKTLTPFVTGQHMIALIFTDATPGDLLTTGNILIGSTTVAQNSIVLMFYDPNQAKYYPAKLT